MGLNSEIVYTEGQKIFKGKGDKGGYQAFLLFPQYFPTRHLPYSCLKFGLCDKRVEAYITTINRLDSLPNNKISYFSKFKAFADNNKCDSNIEFVFGR